MGRNFRRAAIVVGLLGGLMLLAAWTDYPDGSLITDKTARLMLGYDRAAQRGRLLSSGPNGELMVTELNPDAFQFAATTIVNVALTANQANSATPGTGLNLTPYDASIYGYKWARITTSSAANAATPWSVRWWGSPDGITYKPITLGARALPTGSTRATTFVYGNGTSVPVDTLRQLGNGNCETGWFALKDGAGAPITLKKLVAVASCDTATGSVTVTVEVAGRQH